MSNKRLEDFGAKAGAVVILKGEVGFNSLAQKCDTKSKFNHDKVYTITLDRPEIVRSSFDGQSPYAPIEEYVKSRIYQGTGNFAGIPRITVNSKSPSAPQIFDRKSKHRQGISADRVLIDANTGKPYSISSGTVVYVLCKVFQSKRNPNLGFTFDGVLVNDINNIPHFQGNSISITDFGIKEADTQPGAPEVPTYKGEIAGIQAQAKQAMANSQTDANNNATAPATDDPFAEISADDGEPPF